MIEIFLCDLVYQWKGWWVQLHRMVVQVQDAMVHDVSTLYGPQGNGGKRVGGKRGGTLNRRIFWREKKWNIKFDTLFWREKQHLSSQEHVI